MAKLGIDTQLPTKTFKHFQQLSAESEEVPRKANLGELAIQETMNAFALRTPSAMGIFLFEDHRIARPSFVLPEDCRKVSPRAFLTFLKEKGWLASAAEVERKAIANGRSFSRLRFPPS